MNFIETIISDDLSSGRHTSLMTRFPPEPNGYLHIGHAKAIALNFTLAEQFGGVCNLRFDDTNPTTEDTEFVEQIQADIKWLGFDWEDRLYFASSYFDQLYDFAVVLIKKGLAFVCSQTEEEMRATRGTVTTAGTVSPWASRTVAENLDLFAQMRAGQFKDGEMTLRSRIDMASTNMKMRDPALYRIRHAHHHRTQGDWCIYPMYDFAHCLSDAIEGITHSICTLEFDNNRELYDWVIKHAMPHSTPHQYEFARLNVGYTITSKRKLLQLVTGGHVSGWDDPRMPTIAGMRRRGIPASAIRSFVIGVGVAKNNSLIDVARFEYCIREDLNESAPRYSCVIDPIEVVITNHPTGEISSIDAELFPQSADNAATRRVPYGPRLYVEREDFMEVPAAGFRRLSPGRSVRLRNGPFITCDRVERDSDGLKLYCSQSDQKPAGKTVTLHWVEASTARQVEVRLFDRLFSAESPGADGDFLQDLNPNSLKVVSAYCEPALAQLDGSEWVQFERVGYFFSDPVDFSEGSPVFNRVVTLKDAWARQTSATDEKDNRKQVSRRPLADKRVLVGREIETANSLMTEHGLGQEQAEVLAQNSRARDVFQKTVTAGAPAASSANWITNHLSTDERLEAVEIAQFAEFVKIAESTQVNRRQSKHILGLMIKTGKSAPTIITEEGIEAVADPDQLRSTIEAIIEANTAEADRYRSGDKKLMAFFIGQVMRHTKGKADPAVTRKVLGDLLG